MRSRERRGDMWRGEEMRRGRGRGRGRGGGGCRERERCRDKYRAICIYIISVSLQRVGEKDGDEGLPKRNPQLRELNVHVS